MYVSEKWGYSFSASIRKSDLDRPNFITIEPTDQTNKWYNFEYKLDDSTWMAQQRTTYYVGFDDIYREGT